MGVKSLLSIEENDYWFECLIQQRSSISIDCWQGADRIIVVNRCYQAMLESVGVDAKKIKYITNGFDGNLVPKESKASVRKRLGLGLDEFVFVNTSFIEPKKDHRTLIEAFGLLLAAGRKAKLIIIGNGPLMNEVVAQIKKAGLSHSIRLLGSQPPKAVLEWNTASDICINFSKAEGNPTVMFEALGCGRPYVGSNVGGVADVIVDDSLGLIAPHGNAKALCDLMHSAMGRIWDEDRIRSFASQYTWDAIAD